MLRHKILYCLIALILLAEASPLYSQLSNKDKALWIVTSLAPFTYWKNEVSFNEYTIGVYGSNDMYNELKTLSASHKIKNKPIVVINIKKLKDFIPTTILYVSKNVNEEMPEITKLVAFNTLFITDEYAGNDFMLNFMAPNPTKRNIDVLPAVARKSGITFDDKLLSIAGKDEVLRSLYSKTEKQLLEEKEKLEKQRAELEKLAEELKRLKAENKKERDEIERQKEVNLRQRSEIESQKTEINQQRERLTEVQKNLNVQNEKLNLNTRILDNQIAKIKEQEEEVRLRNEERKQQEAEIEKSKVDLQVKDIILGQQITQLEFQNRALVTFVVLIVLIVILAIYYWRNYQINQQINEELRFKNIAINRQKEEISTQQKQTELLNKELEKLSIVAAQTDNAVTIMDKNGNFEWVNVGFTRMYGYTLQLLKNELDENLIRVSNHPEIKGLFHKCITEKKTIVYETLNKTRTGKEIWVQTSLTPILDNEEEVSKLITIETDITKIKNAEEEIRKQHDKIYEQSKQLETTNKELERLSLVASETENAIAIMDAAGNFQWINDGYTRLFGYNFSQLINEYSRNIITKDVDNFVRQLIKECIEQVVPVTYETPWQARGKKTIWVQTTLTPIKDRKGNLKTLVAISSDISKLKQAEQEIRQQSEELMAQKEELMHQNEQIELQNENIRASISYAQTIQSAILPPVSALNRDFQSFIIYKPKDIVSGDFYWHSYQPSSNGKSGKHFLAVVDCTGHGVPGAFMSMIGSQLLNEIIVEKGIEEPNRILETMNSEIIQILRQEDSENNDGMDVCLCTIEKEKPGYSKVIFSGAKRPLFYYSSDERKLEYIKGTRKTIGGTQAKRNTEVFKNHEIILKNGDLIYLTTDGIIDQPAPDRVRFGSPRLFELLKSIGDKPLELQKEFVEKALNSYQQHESQRDDVTFVGVKF